MQVRIDYNTELIYDEKKKINWAVEEYEVQFGGQKEYSQADKILANEIMNNIINSIDYTNEEVYNYFQEQLKKLERRFGGLFETVSDVEE
ncbi:MAG: hypothetical protein ACTSU2_04305 [Promethearchaeota archaeon]